MVYQRHSMIQEKELAFPASIPSKTGKSNCLVLHWMDRMESFSPDEKYLYVSNWDVTAIASTKIILRFEVNADGTLSNEKEFFNMNAEQGEIALDGLKRLTAKETFTHPDQEVYGLFQKRKIIGKRQRSGTASQYGLGRCGWKKSLPYCQNRSLQNQARGSPVN